jgi:hypothetical protein
VQHGNDTLFDCFREDHRQLGSAFHRLSTRLRAGDIAGARQVAQRLDETAGAHIGYEEEAFYPRLVPFLGKAEVTRMYAEHRQGLAVIRTLADHDPARRLDRRVELRLLKQSEAMEEHIADCAELFDTMARISESEQHQLYRELLEWRRRRPVWTRYASGDRAS